MSLYNLRIHDCILVNFVLVLQVNRGRGLRTFKCPHIDMLVLADDESESWEQRKAERREEESSLFTWHRDRLDDGDDVKVTRTSEQYAAGVRISIRRPPRKPMTYDDHFGDNARADEERPYVVVASILIVGIRGDFLRGEGTLAQ